MNELVQIDKLNSDQDAFAMAIIASHGENLPDTIQEIIPILAFSKAKMEAFNALSDAARKVQDQEALNKSALESGQRWGIVHLYGQKRLGEITREIPKDTTNSIAKAARLGEVDYFFESKKDVLDKAGIKKWESTDAERIAAHPEILERVIEDAKEKGYAPRISDVIKQIKAETYKANLYTPKPVDDISDVALTVFNKLGDCYEKLTKMWPHKENISASIVSQIADIIDGLYELTNGGEDE